MKKIGVIAGIGPESTIQYYRSIIELFQERLSTKDYPEIILHSINMTELANYVFSDDLEGTVRFLKKRIKVLENAGVECAVMASNTPHIVFERLVEVVDVPMISIVEETCKLISSKNINKIGLLGTKSTMSKGFYQRTGLKYGLDIVTPEDNNQDYVHQKYMNELVLNQILPETKKRFIRIIENLKSIENIEGLILGGTELSLMLRQEDFDEIQIFDTTHIHVNSIVNKMTEK